MTGGHANLAMDVVGYFKVPGSYGDADTITGVHAAIGGGSQQTASGDASFIGAGTNNMATGTASVVTGGDFNTASGQDAVVSGGIDNLASATASTVAGGWDNIASGLKSFAAGYGAQALKDGEFVWSDDSTDTPFEASTASEPIGWPSAANTFNVRATGGVWFVTGIDSGGLPTTGVNLPAGSGSWTSNSDRAIKENFRVVDDDEVLRKVAAMPVTSWNYIAEGALARHLGPMAQDFYAAFGLGQSERSIATVDESGIALAAIKASMRERSKTRRGCAARTSSSVRCRKTSARGTRNYVRSLARWTRSGRARQPSHLAERSVPTHAGRGRASCGNGWETPSTGIGGGGEIRTHGRVAPSRVFKTRALNRSATPPVHGSKPARSRAAGARRTAPAGVPALDLQSAESAPTS